MIAGTSSAAKFLVANGIAIFKVRDESIKLLGKGDMYFFSPEHPPLTEDAQRALDWAVDLKLKSGVHPNFFFLISSGWEKNRAPCSTDVFAFLIGL